LPERKEQQKQLLGEVERLQRKGCEVLCARPDRTTCLWFVPQLFYSMRFVSQHHAGIREPRMSASEPDLPRGVSLQEAFEQWSDPADLERLRSLPAEPAWYPPRPHRVVPETWLFPRSRPPPPPDNALRLEREEIEARLLSAFLDKLRSGELVAIGVEAPLRATSRRIVIARHLWESLRPRFRSSWAEGDGLKIIRVEVLEASALASLSGTPNRGHAPSAREDAAQIQLSNDDKVLTIGDEEIVLRGEIQQSVIRRLVDGFYAGKRLRTKDILAHAGSNADTLKKAFRHSPHWPKLSSVLRQEGGFSWLEP
jgi:hypothetical protein